MKLNQFLLILLIVFMLSCASIPIYTNVTSSTFSAKVIDGETGEPMVALNISEADQQFNAIITNINGDFSLRFNNQYPILLISGSFYPIYVDVSEIENGIIIYDETLLKKSKQAEKRLNDWIKQTVKKEMY